MSIPNFSLAGKVAVVTGGRRGMGRAISLAFAEAGADVAICDWVVEGGELQSVAEEIRKLGRRSLAIRADISNKADVDNLVKEVIQQFGVIDILANNAGINPKEGPLIDTQEDMWDKLMSVNLKGFYLCSQAVGKKMVERKQGNIINIASRAAFYAYPGIGIYCISKAGVVMLTRVLARDLASYGIRVNGIAPSNIKTDINRPVWTNRDSLEKRGHEIPLGRMAEPTVVADAALFLASDASSYITGHTIFVDGGRSA